MLWRKGPVRYEPATAGPFMWQDGELHWHDEPARWTRSTCPRPQPAEPDLTDITGDHDRFEVLADQVFGPQESEGALDATAPAPTAASLHRSPS